MIKAIEYYKSLPRFGGGIRYNDIEDFIEAVKREMKREGNVMLILEPGDATHYEFLLIQCGAQLAVASHVHGWSIIITCDPMTLTPRYIEDHVGMKINPYTLGVVCQILHDIYDGSGRHYDWDKAIPIEIVRPEEANNGETK